MPGHMSRQEFRLVEAALPLLAPVERHRNNGIKTFVHRNGALQICRQRPRERLHPGILEQVNQTAQRAFVDSEAGRTIEPAKARAAGGAYALLIERPRIEERRIANGAEVVGLEGSGRSETAGTDRNPCPFEKRAFANAAIVRKKQRKNSVRDPANEIEGSRSRYRTTREGAPPDTAPEAPFKAVPEASVKAVPARRRLRSEIS